MKSFLSAVFLSMLYKAGIKTGRTCQWSRILGQFVNSRHKAKSNICVCFYFCPWTCSVIISSTVQCLPLWATHKFRNCFLDQIFRKSQSLKVGLKKCGFSAWTCCFNSREHYVHKHLASLHSTFLYFLFCTWSNTSNSGGQTGAQI